MEDFNNQSTQYDLSFKKYIKRISISVYSKENVIEKDKIEDLICPICFYILKDPISCSSNKNAHSFCKECIEEYLKKNNKCPICKLNFEYIINNEVINSLNKVSFGCIYKKEGCGDILSYSEYLNHINNCKYNNTKYECNIKKYNEYKIEFEICGFIGDKIIIEQHFKKCGLTQFNCLFCNINILLMDLEDHVTNKCKIRYEKYPNGNKYIGQKINNIKEGYGIYYYHSYFFRYEGEFKNDKKEGYGIEFYNNGDNYEGEFKNDKKEGYGIEFYNNGDNYKGEFKNDLREGYGEYFFCNHSLFQGEFQNHWRNGYGVLYFINGAKYEGEFKNDKIEGYGFFSCPDGSKYIGGFKDNMKDGFGINYYSDGSRYIGIYKNNIREGYGIEYNSNGNKYKGNFKNDKAEGYGIVYFPNGDRYEGEFIDGIYNGYAIFYSHLGLQVKRYFKNDLSTKILYIIYKIILALNYLYSKSIKNKMTLLFIIILIIGIIIN